MARNPLSPYRSGGVRFGDPFLSLHREMNRLFDDAFRGAGGQNESGQGGEVALTPHVDVSETADEVRICAELPGVKEEDIDVTLNDDVLTIRGDKKFERKDDKENYHFMERSYGSFQRSMRLPYSVNPDEVRADFENGVLTVSIPKSQQQQRSNKIPIKGASSGQARLQQGGPGEQSRGEQGRVGQGRSGQGGQQPHLQQAASQPSGSRQGEGQQGGAAGGPQAGMGPEGSGKSGRT